MNCPFAELPSSLYYCPLLGDHIWIICNLGGIWLIESYKLIQSVFFFYISVIQKSHVLKVLTLSVVYCYSNHINNLLHSYN